MATVDSTPGHGGSFLVPSLWDEAKELGLDWTDRTGSNRSEKKTLPNSHASARTRHRTIEQRVLGQLGGREGRERKRKGEARKGEDRRACELWSEVR
jgi:hypothetical protein